ncbi:MAG: FAD-binding oxidoreductase [Candidatus Hodarchaeota archaeon]
MSLRGTIYSDLEKIVGPDYISDAQHVRWIYSRDVGIAPGHPPDVVLIPRSTYEIQEIIKLSNTQKIPVYIRGAGACYAGGVIPVKGGILLDLTRMNKLLYLDKNAESCLTECGITCGALMNELETQGFKIPVIPDSALTGTVGGFLATSGIGTLGSAFYGSIGDITLGVKVVLPNGGMIETGSSGVNPNAKCQFNRYVGMPDLTGLFIGSDGSLGVITEAAFRVVPLPELTVYRAYQFKTHQAAERTTVRAKRKGLHLVSVTISTSLHDLPRLNIIIEGPEKTTKIEATLLDKIALEEDGIDLGPEVAQRTFIDALNPGEQFLLGSRVMNGSFVPLVGIGNYLDFLKQECLRITAKYGFQCLFGAFNVLNSWDAYLKFFFNESDPNELQKARNANADLQGRLYEAGAPPTKRGQLWNQFAPQSKFFELFQSIKSCLDPNNIMSPGVHGLGL